MLKQSLHVGFLGLAAALMMTAIPSLAKAQQSSFGAAQRKQRQERLIAERANINAKRDAREAERLRLIVAIGGSRDDYAIFSRMEELDRLDAQAIQQLTQIKRELDNLEWEELEEFPNLGNRRDQLLAKRNQLIDKISNYENNIRWAESRSNLYAQSARDGFSNNRLILPSADTGYALGLLAEARRLTALKRRAVELLKQVNLELQGGHQ